MIFPWLADEYRDVRLAADSLIENLSIPSSFEKTRNRICVIPNWDK
jgi:hypothetical protein